LASVPHIIDLSQDFRLKETSQDFVYGLSEWNREAIVKARHIANPGCFATAIQLAVLPLLAARLISSELYVNGITGSTGAGQALSASSHFSWRANNISIYKALQHQHLFEIRESIQSIHPDFKEAIHFVPYRGDFTRGIFCSVQTRCDAELEVVLDVFRETYKKSFFVFISEQTVDLKQVINTNKCFISCEKEGNQLIVSVAIDNLLKGAAGQAVQNMNLLFGVPEKTGLHLKASAF
jgi:N-acetyl-gamma-glutamyl-phosphate reductase